MAARPQAIPLQGAGQTRRLAVRPLLLFAALALVVLALGLGRFFSALSASAAFGGVYREVVVGENVRLDPFEAERIGRDPDLTPLLFRGLVQVDQRGQVSPDLAASWEIGADGRIYRFYLRPDLVWDDGRPLTSADVLFSVEQAAAAARQARPATFWADVGARAPSSEVVEFELRESLAAFLEHATLPIVARHAPPVAPLPLAANDARPASNGPYRLSDLPQPQIVLERNPAYAGPTPRLDQLEFHLVPSRQAALEALLTGRADGFAGLSPAERAALGDSPLFQFYEVPEYGKYGLLALNTRGSIFGDRLVRQAVDRAIDRTALVNAVLEGAGESAQGPLAPASWAFDPSAQPPGYSPLAGASLLEQAGWERGERGGPRRRGSELLKISLLTTDAAPRQREAAELVAQLRAVGFDVAVRALPLDQLRQDHLATGQFDAALIGRSLPLLDPDQFALWHSTQIGGAGDNFAAISSPELDRWLELGRREVDLETRREAYRQFQVVWAEEQPSVPLYYPHSIYAVNRQLQGVRPIPLPTASWRLRQLAEWHYRPSRDLASWIRLLIP